MAASDILNNITGVLQLTQIVEGTAVPVIAGIVKEVKQAFVGETVEYTVVLQVGQQELQDAATEYQASLDEINKERATAGLPPITVTPNDSGSV